MNVATPEGQTVFISAGGKKKEERVPDPIPPIYSIVKGNKTNPENRCGPVSNQTTIEIIVYSSASIPSSTLMWPHLTPVRATRDPCRLLHISQSPHPGP